MVRFNLERGQITFLPQKITETFGYSDTGEKIKLVNHTLLLEPDILTIHPDVLALICTLAFYPYLKSAKELIFPKSVSPNFRKILHLHGIRPLVLNEDLNLQPRTVSGNSNVGLSWGGGFDSWAAHLLQPELYKVVIHQINPDNPVPNPEISTYETVTTNIRSLSELAHKENEPAGWVTWPQVLIGCLWLSEKHHLGAISIGGNLGSTYLKDGLQYHPTHLKPNKWYETFRLVQLPLYTPLAGLSDLAIYQFLEQQNAPFSKIKYCSLSPTIENCHQCVKCQRRELLMGHDLGLPVAARGPTIDFLQKGREDYETWLKKYYQPALELAPYPNMKRSLVKALQKHQIELTTQEDELQVEHYGWNLTKIDKISR